MVHKEGEFTEDGRPYTQKQRASIAQVFLEARGYGKKEILCLHSFARLVNVDFFSHLFNTFR